MCEKCRKNASDPNSGPWKCEDVSVWTYHTLPENMRLATENDLFDLFGKPRYGVQFLAQSFYSGKYEAYTLSSLLDERELKTFIRSSKVYVKKERK